MYKTIKKILTTRDAVLLKNSGYYRVITRFKDSDQEFISSGWKKTKDLAKDGMFDSYIYNAQFDDYDDWKIIEVFDMPKERFKVGDEVYILKGELKGKTAIIKSVLSEYNDNYEVNLKKINSLENQTVAISGKELSYPFKQEDKNQLRASNKSIGDYIDFDFEKNVMSFSNGKKYKLTEIR